LAACVRRAKDGEMIEWATDIRMRAERKAGQLPRKMAERGEREGRGQPEKMRCSYRQ
jgi:hypothetical protein